MRATFAYDLLTGEHDVGFLKGYTQVAADAKFDQQHFDRVVSAIRLEKEGFGVEDS